MLRTVAFLVLVACSRPPLDSALGDSPAPLPQPTGDGVATNVILVIGDGMGPAQIHAAATASGGRLALDRLPYTGISRTASANDWVTDSAAAATAMASGHKTRNYWVGVDASGQPVPSLIALAEATGRSTGMVVTCDITHATPAAFVAHVPDRRRYAEIATYWPTAGVDVVIGGGARRFDGKLGAEWRAEGATFVSSLDEVAAATSTPLVALLADEHLPPVSERGVDWLSRAVTEAVRLLEQDEDGYLLVVEGAQIDWGGHGNDASRMITETIDLDRAVGALLDRVAPAGDTLLIVTADHETGGFAITQGNPSTGLVEGAFVTEHHTAIPVAVYAHGPGAEAFTGTYENTAIFGKILDALGLDAPATTP